MAKTEGISPQVTRFITDYIDSVMELELLLLLSAAPQRARSAQDVASELHIAASWVRAHLDAMIGRGLLVRDEQTPPRFRFAPSTPELRQAVEAVAAAYAQRRVTIVGLIAAKPIDSIRTFADAFRLRKDPNDG